MQVNKQTDIPTHWKYPGNYTKEKFQIALARLNQVEYKAFALVQALRLEKVRMLMGARWSQ